MRRATVLLLSTALPTFAMADAPKVATDIGPVQALVSQIMQGVGEPTQIVPATASPHHYSMRPSEARALSNADIVFWIGPELSPAIDRAVDSLAEGKNVALLHAPDVVTFEFREGPFLGDHDDHDDHDHDKHDDHDHAEHKHDDHADKHDDHDHAKHKHDDHADKHDDHDHAEHAEHAEKDDDHAGHEHHDHAHDGIDPHAWLSPDNLSVWAQVIATELSKLDPANASAYFSNAAAEQERLANLKKELAISLSPAAGKPFFVFHDAYQYFERSFAMEASGTLLSTEGDRPSAESLSEVREELKELTAEHKVCIFTEPQFDTSLVDSVASGTGVKVGTMDPLGSALAQDNELHRTILKSLASSVTGCFGS